MLPIQHWPNGISLLRLPLAAAFLVTQTVWARLLILALAGVSDVLDGWLARRLGQTSRSGEILDPLTDKLFVFTALTSFVLYGQLSIAQLLVLLARDIYIGLSAGVAGLTGLQLAFRARPAGKAATFLQLLSLTVLVLVPDRVGPFVVLTGVAAGIAILDYTAVALNVIRRGEAN